MRSLKSIDICGLILRKTIKNHICKLLFTKNKFLEQIFDDIFEIFSSLQLKVDKNGR